MFASRFVLNIACGSCREVTYTVLQAGVLAKRTGFHSVDIEPKMTAYAQRKANNLKDVSYPWNTTDVIRSSHECENRSS